MIAALGMSAFALLPALAVAEDEVAKHPGRSSQTSPEPGAAADNVQAINADYDRELLQLQRRRLERMSLLAARQEPPQAAATYEQLFRLAIANDLFRDAEPAANALLKNGSPSVVATGLAHLVKIIAEADRGAFDESAQSLRLAVAERKKAAQTGAPRADLPTGQIVEIIDAYYQRLIHAAQYETARDALRLIFEHAERPVLKEFLSTRLNRLDMLGRPAPGIEGADIEGKPFSLAAARGKVVLVVFWASWCLPCAAEIESLQQMADSYSGRGLQIVGINLDASQEGGQKLETVLPNIRRFLLDQNVGWPTLINGTGEKDFAKSYAVTEIPANILIDRHGTITQIDLVPRNLQAVVARAVRD
jgi:thiol-disulfide isomerase/thioredoxin